MLSFMLFVLDESVVENGEDVANDVVLVPNGDDDLNGVFVLNGDELALSVENGLNGDDAIGFVDETVPPKGVCCCCCCCENAPNGVAGVDAC